MNSHTSVLGVRAVAPNTFVLPTDVIEQAASDGFADEQEPATAEPQSEEVHCLLAFPAECNFSGRRIPLQADTFTKLKRRANAMLHQGHAIAVNDAARRLDREQRRRWWTLLDAAKFVGSHKLDLSAFPKGAGPDFVCVSFYKIFG
jgi:molybdenum cofactor sulfurtransferase